MKNKQRWAHDNFLALRQRQRENVTEPQGPVRDQKKIRKIVRLHCLDGVATTSIVKWHLQTSVCPENMVTLSRQNCQL